MQMVAQLPKNSASSANSASPQRDRAYRGLRRLLILQRVPEGQRLREPQWATQLGVNRMALREAFARLEAEGLIERGPTTGYFVPTLSDTDIREVMQIRILLECGAIEQICKNGKPTPRNLKGMRNACDDFEELLRRRYVLGVTEADRRFHESLIDAASNRRLSILYHRAPLPLITRKTQQQDDWMNSCTTTLNEHRAILKAIASGNATEAKRLMRAHLNKRSLLPLSD